MTFRFFRKQRLGTVQMGHTPPYVLNGGAALLPLFGWDEFISGVSQLPQTLNLNGVDITASTFYVGDDSTGATWPSRNGAGSTLGLTGAGTDPTPGQLTAMSDATKSVLYGSGSQANIAPDTTTAELGTEDTVIVLHYYHQYSASNPYICGRKTGLTAAQQGWVFWTTGTNQAEFRFSNGTTGGQFPISVSPGWTTLIIVINNSSSATWGMRAYRAGVFSTSQANPLGAGFDSAAPPLQIGSCAISTAPRYLNRVAFLGIWKGSFLPDDASATTIMNDIASEIAQRLDGTWPTYAGGSRLRQAAPRNSAAYAIVEDGTDIVAELVTANMMRVCRSGPAAGIGLLSERFITNVLLRSNDLANASWTKTNSTIGANVVGPDRYLSMQPVSSTAVAAVHGVEQTPTLTAATWTVSCFMRAGALTWGYLDVSTIANVSCYFDLANGVVGTVGAAVLGRGMERWTSTLWRVWITFTGTAAAHTIRALTATGDGGIVHAGGTANELDMGWFQAEAYAKMTSPIRTEGATASRNADALYFAGAGNHPAATNPYTVRLEFVVPPATPKTTRVPWNGSTGLSSPQDYWSLAITSGRINTQGYAPGLQWNLTGSIGAALNALDDSTSHIARTTIETNNIASYLDGVLATPVDLLAATPGVDRIYVGGVLNQSAQLEGVLLSGKIYDQAVAPGEQGTGSDT